MLESMWILQKGSCSVTFAEIWTRRAPSNSQLIEAFYDAPPSLTITDNHEKFRTNEALWLRISSLGRNRIVISSVSRFFYGLALLLILLSFVHTLGHSLLVNFDVASAWSRLSSRSDSEIESVAKKSGDFFSTASGIEPGDCIRFIELAEEVVRYGVG